MGRDCAVVPGQCISRQKRGLKEVTKDEVKEKGGLLDGLHAVISVFWEHGAGKLEL